MAGNTGLISADTASRRLQRWQKANAKTKIKPGDHVKVAFEEVIGDRKTCEHMWVRVENIQAGKIVGTLDNDPNMLISVKYGDRVKTMRSHVEDLITEAEVKAQKADKSGVQYRRDLEYFADQGCAECGDGEHLHEAFLTGKCHPGAGSTVVYSEGVITVNCFACKKEVVRVAVASRV